MIERVVPGTTRLQFRSPPPKKLPDLVTATGTPQVFAYSRLIRSPHALPTSYGSTACSGVASVYGNSSCGPYALSEDATMTARIVGLRRAASSSDHVPRTLVSYVSTGLRFATG